MAAHPKSELVSLPPSCKFASRVDEFTDGTRLAALFVYVCYTLTIEGVFLPKCMALGRNGARTVGVEHLF